jgi:transposase
VPGLIKALECPGFHGVWISGFWCLTPGGTDGTTGLPSRVSTQGPRPARDGKSIASIAHDLDVSDQTDYGWRRQDRIERGLQPGLSTAENEELAKAKKRIAELETELAISRRATELLKEQTSPEGGTRPSK